MGSFQDHGARDHFATPGRVTLRDCLFLKSTPSSRQNEIPADSVPAAMGRPKEATYLKSGICAYESIGKRLPVLDIIGCLQSATGVT